MKRPPPYAVQRITAQHAALMGPLNDMFAAAFEDTASYAAARPSHHYLEQLLADDTFIALAAMAGHTVIGGLVAYELRKFEQERSEIYIYDLAVDASYRRLGIATSLVQELKSIAREKGAYVIFVQADSDDPVAIALYTKMGVREDVLHFDIEPSPLDDQ